MMSNFCKMKMHYHCDATFKKCNCKCHNTCIYDDHNNCAQKNCGCDCHGL